jgi:hypothetical protein
MTTSKETLLRRRVQIIEMEDAVSRLQIQLVKERDLTDALDTLVRRSYPKMASRCLCIDCIDQELDGLKLRGA